MIVSQPLTILNSSSELLKGRVAQTSAQAEEALPEPNPSLASGIDWIEGTLTLSF